MNKNSVCIIAILFLALPIAAQEVKSPLEKLLWESVSPCYENFYEDDESEHSDIEIINDAKNGFLHVSGTYPTCGCYCSATVGVYRDKNGDYVILQKLEDTCNWQQITSTNTTLTNILPEGFGILNFMDDAMTNANTGHPLFYVDIGIPRHGTVTKLELKLIPFGLQPKQEGLLTYGYSQNDSRLKSFGGLLQLVQKLKSLNVLDPMLQNDFSKLIPEDNELIDRMITSGLLESRRQITQELGELKLIYDTYLKLSCKEIILDWDKNTAKFYIKKKGEKPIKISFRDFLLNNSHWSAMC